MAREHSQLFQTQIRADLVAQQEADRVQEFGVPWRSYERSYQDYPFGALVGKELKDYLAGEAVAKKRPLVVLAAMDSGDILRLLSRGDQKNKSILSGGAFVGLADWRSDSQREYDSEHNIYPVYGNIASLKVRRQLNQFLRSQRIEGFDAIICEPVGGWAGVGGSFKIQRFIAACLYGLLAKQDGVLLIEFDSYFEVNTRYQQWVQKLRQTIGLQVESQRNALKLVRRPNSPARLP